MYLIEKNSSDFRLTDDDNSFIDQATKNETKESLVKIFLLEAILWIDPMEPFYSATNEKWILQILYK